MIVVVPPITPISSVFQEREIQICSAVAVLEEIRAGIPSHVTEELTRPPRPTDAEIRERMSGNICRCGAYSNILEAIEEVGGINP